MNLFPVIPVPVRNIKNILLILLLLFAASQLVPPLFIGFTFCPKLQQFSSQQGRQIERKLIRDLTHFIADEQGWLVKNKSSSEVRQNVNELCQTQQLLHGQINVTFEAPSFHQIAKCNIRLRNGGQFWPSDCESEQLDRIAIIIPYRNRERQLRAIIHHLHPILQRQQLNYMIIVIEQSGNETFNKALLMNIAFKEALMLPGPQFGCFIFHDVDLFLQDDRGIYNCADKPIHLSEYIDKFNYEKWGGTDVLFGGVVSIKRRLFELVNGYSNIFFGWGAEDEEMRMRLRLYKIPIITPNREFYRFKMFRHGPDVGNQWNQNGRILISQTGERMRFDGLNSLRYNLLSRDFLPTHTHLLVNFTREDIYQAVYGERTENLKRFGSVVS